MLLWSFHVRNSAPSLVQPGNGGLAHVYVNRDSRGSDRPPVFPTVVANASPLVMFQALALHPMCL